MKRAPHIALAASALLAAACHSDVQSPTNAALSAQSLSVPTRPEDIGEARPGSGYLVGYLKPAQLPDSASLLPPPPAENSAAAAADLEVHQSTRALRGTARWALAQSDNELHFPEATRAFSCTLGVDISYESTPHLYTLMRRTLSDAGLSTYGAKELYQRTRPFALMGEESCVPDAEERLREDGSYPSGHTALGWAWGLVLAQLSPDRADALLQRGYDFGQSRVVCGVHWQSDVDAGRIMGAATVARLQADPLFRAQAELARHEIEAARSAGDLPHDCPAP